MILEIATIRIKIIFEHPYDLDTNHMRRVKEMYEVKEDSDRNDFVLKTVKKKTLPSGIVSMECRNNALYHETEDTFIFQTESWVSTIFWDKKLMTTWFYKTSNIRNDSDDFLFMRSLKLLISLLVLKKKGLPLHCSAIANKNNNSIIFSGKSSTGKTYTAKILSCKLRWKILNDEFNIIMPLNGSYFVYSTPFTSPRKFKYCSNGKSLIKHIYFLKKNICNRVKDIDFHKKYFYMVGGTYSFPTSNKFSILLMENAENICRIIPISELSLNHKSNIAKKLAEFLNLGEYSENG